MPVFQSERCPPFLAGEPAGNPDSTSLALYSATAREARSFQHTNGTNTYPSAAQSSIALPSVPPCPGTGWIRPSHACSLSVAQVCEAGDAVRLPVNTNPPLTGKLRHAFPLSVISLSSRYLPWFYSNYVQLFIDGKRGFPAATLDFQVPPDHPAMPLLEVSPADVRTLSHSEFWEAMEDCLAARSYVELFADEYYVPGRATYLVEHFRHRQLIHGFDRTRRRFDVLGFSTRGKFDSSPVPYADLWLAASSQYSATVGAARERELEPVRVLRYAPQGNCRLDLDSIRRLLGDFYHATDSRVYEPGEAEAVLQREGLGIEVYGCLQRRLEYSLSHPQFCDFLSFHVLWEHKRCMA